MNFIRFIQWQWRKLELWQKFFVFAMFLQGLGWTRGDELGQWIGLSGLLIIFGFMTKWFVWEPLRDNWIKYQEERQGLFDKIKNSDSQNQ